MTKQGTACSPVRHSYDKKELAVAALSAGTVIDHIPSSALFKAVKILGIANIHTPVTIGNNLPSKRLAAKGIIKVADVEFPEAVLNRIAIIAPTARINIIRDFKVVEKRQVELPEKVVGIAITRNASPIMNRCQRYSISLTVKTRSV